jgi:hypothetical protein
VELEAARVRLQDAANRLAKVLVSEGPRVLLVDALSQLQPRMVLCHSRRCWPTDKNVGSTLRRAVVRSGDSC